MRADVGRAVALGACLAAVAGGTVRGDPGAGGRKYELTLEDFAEGKALRMHLYFGASCFGRGWAMVRGANHPIYPVDVAGLGIRGDALRGGVIVRGGRSTCLPPMATCTLSATVIGDAVRGTYQAEVNLNAWQEVGKIEYAKVSGPVSGRVLTDEQVRDTYGLAPGKDYPCLRGPTGGGQVPPGQWKLVDDIRDARPVWRSEENLPGGYYHFRGPVNSPFGGYASPIVYRGRVYVYYFEGAGEPLKFGWVEARGAPADIADLANRREGRDVLLCVDAANGRTLWKYVHQEGPQPFWQHKRGPHNTPCAAYGKVFMHSGINGRAKCLDAETGQLLWEYAEHRNVDYWRRGLERLRAWEDNRPITKRGSIDYEMLCTAPNYADGVFVFCPSRGTLIGLDAETGRRLWTQSFWTLGGNAGPHRWVHGGKEYLISGGVALEPRTGKVLWRVGWRGHTSAVSEHYAAFNGDGKTFGMRIYRVSPERAELLHTLPPEYAMCGCNNGCAISDGHLYAYGLDETTRVATFLVVNLETGSVVYRKRAPRWATSYFPVIGDGRLFGEGPSMCRAEPSAFEPRGAFPGTFGAPSMSVGTSCAYSDGRLFFRANDSLMCYDVRDTRFNPRSVLVRSFSADRREVEPGAAATLAWNVRNATAVRVEPGLGKVAPVGKAAVSPAAPTTYTLTAEGPGGPVTRQVTLAVLVPREPDSPASLQPGILARVYRYGGDGRLPAFGSLDPLGCIAVRTIEFTMASERKRPLRSAPMPIAAMGEFDIGIDLPADGPGRKGGFESFGLNEQVAAELTGYVRVPRDGVYTFFTESRDASALFIGPTLVVDNDDRRLGMVERSGRIALKRGCHPIRVRYCRTTGEYGLLVRWSGPGLSKAVIPADALAHAR